MLPHHPEPHHRRLPHRREPNLGLLILTSEETATVCRFFSLNLRLSPVSASLAVPKRLTSHKHSGAAIGQLPDLIPGVLPARIRSVKPEVIEVEHSFLVKSAVGPTE